MLADILNLKKMQIEGIMSPEEELIDDLEPDTGHMRTLAQGYLDQLAKTATANAANGGLVELRA